MEEKQSLIINPAQQMQISTEVAAVCAEIVKKTAIQIRGRRYVRVEGWQAIATAHGFVAGARDVERIETGWKAIGELRRISDGCLIATAEGFVGEGEGWGAEYASRAMAQTRAISRVCRSAFAHCVVLIDPQFSTIPAEEAEDHVRNEIGTPRESTFPKKPVKYEQENLVNKQLQEATQRRKEGAK